MELENKVIPRNHSYIDMKKSVLIVIVEKSNEVLICEEVT